MGDNLLIVGFPLSINEIIENIQKRFKSGRVIRDNYVVVYRILISRNHHGCTILDMSEFIDKITPIKTTRERRKQLQSNFTDAEKKRFLQLTGSLNFLGHGTLLQAAYAASHLQQHIGALQVEHLVLADKILNELKRLHPSITLKPIPSEQLPCFIAFNDASHGHSSYGQTGYISGMFLPARGESVFHAIDWCSEKQSRVSFSTFGAEIIAAASSADRIQLIADKLALIYCKMLPLVLPKHSFGLYTTISTLHERKDYRLLQTVSSIRNAFESVEIDVIQWIKGTYNIADALTKRNIAMHQRLNEILNNGCIGNKIFNSGQRITAS